MTTPLLRVAVIGASGVVGQDLIALLEERRFPIQELVAVGHDTSIGTTIEFLGSTLPVQASAPLQGLDLLFLCTPRAAARDWIRDALRAEVRCIDCSGALAGQDEVPLGIADRGDESDAAPLLAAPGAEALVLGRVLTALTEIAAVEQVVATCLSSASDAGRSGIEALQSETVAVFNQQEAEGATPFARPLAFDVHPATGPLAEEGAAEDEGELAAVLARMLGPELRVDVTKLQIPTFSGLGMTIAIRTREPLTPAQARDALSKAAGVDLREGDDWATLRDAAGQDEVLVSRVRATADGAGILLWAAADPVRLAADNAVRLAERSLLR